MNCPRCNGSFVQKDIDKISLNICDKCHAIWINNDNLKLLSDKIALKSEPVNLADMEIIKVKEEARNCPNCSKPMNKIYFNGTVLDRCDDCKGFLFDNGELAKYFRLFMKNPPGIIDNIAFIEKYCTKITEKKEVIMHEIEIQSKEKETRVISINGFLMLFGLFWLLVFGLIFTAIGLGFIGIPLFVILAFMLPGFKMLKPQEAMVLTVFGKYIGTLRGEGFHYVNPFARSATFLEPISLKARTLESGKQKINDEIGNPIEVGIIVIWEVQDTAKAIFNVDDYKQFLASQSDSALRNIVRMYPYDTQDDSGKTSLRGDSQEISAKLKDEIQRNVKVAGLNIIDAKITHLAYAPEIAVAMLQRQQATAIIDAKKTIVEGAVGMVEMALNQLNNNNIVKLDDAEKAKMVNNLLVTLCSNKEAQPVVKSGFN